MSYTSHRVLQERARDMANGHYVPEQFTQAQLRDVFAQQAAHEAGTSEAALQHNLIEMMLAEDELDRLYEERINTLWLVGLSLGFGLSVGFLIGYLFG